MKTISMSILAFIFIIVIGVVGAMILTYNSLQQQKNHIDMLYDTNQTELSTYTLTIMEKFKINDKYKNDVVEVVRETMNGRYGNETNSPLLKFIKEQNIPFDSKMYLDLMNTISAGRKEFAIKQNERTNSCRQYRNKLMQFPSNIIASMFNFTYDEVQEKCTIVSDERTNEIFNSKTQSPIQFN